eukprot:755278-Hanusia_phi.AAC.2
MKVDLPTPGGPEIPIRIEDRAMIQQSQMRGSLRQKKSAWISVVSLLHHFEGQVQDLPQRVKRACKMRIRMLRPLMPSVAMACQAAKASKLPWPNCGRRGMRGKMKRI